MSGEIMIYETTDVRSFSHDAATKTETDICNTTNAPLNMPPFNSNGWEQLNNSYIFIAWISDSSNNSCVMRNLLLCIESSSTLIFFWSENILVFLFVRIPYVNIISVKAYRGAIIMNYVLYSLNATCGTSKQSHGERRRLWTDAHAQAAYWMWCLK